MTPLTVVKVWLALVPRAVIAAMHTTMIKASMTAYSTAVGPSSALRKLTTDCFSAETISSSQEKTLFQPAALRGGRQLSETAVVSRQRNCWSNVGDKGATRHERGR